MSIQDVSFLTSQECGPHLHAARSEHEGRRHLAAVGNATGRNDRHLHRVDDLRQESEEARLHAHVNAGKGSAVPAGLGSLSNDRVHPALLQDARFGDGGCTTDDEDASALDGFHHLRPRQSEMEAHDLRLCPK